MKVFQLLLFTILFQNASCQDYGKLTYLEHLPEDLEEISGMESIEGSDLLYAVNDSGNEPVLYLYDQELGYYELTAPILKNNDWEDLSSYTNTVTGKTYLYIADLGNNKNRRRDLAIYEIDITDLEPKDQELVNIREISVFYSNQKDFPPKKKERFYDCEAFVRVEDYFYLFSKNRSSDFNGKTQVYRLKADGTSNNAQFLVEIEICNDSKDCLITSADVNSQGEIALLTSDKVFILSNYDEDFTNYDIERHDLNHYSQKESIIYKTDNILWISDEQTKKTGGNLYQLKL
ncbi:Gll0560 protein [Nonlabens ulvanivorans]|uniref:Gll0560 protein n=1 Tax=Nonlabens ulvanivorans TaxID=906888 RepID=A0A081DF48_NONUL|nr:hypothetical protein [Nonlabens ulvanivorans]GAK77544.1 Gll0560 protein [Nonlabens ulvanivorans]GAL75759.1 Gll0560 protein [Nonlabens ulvanivorans]